jgi:tetratricopeptide (TPR) repeat protein
MRYLDAGTLKERLSADGLSLPEVDRLFTQIADALHYAHTQGVIHRDIKPANILIDARGDAFLTDFGIAKLLEDPSQLTLSGTMTGTPAYMSPEQAQGERLDPRSDIYSLGIVLYEMITGRVPFEADTPLAIVLKMLAEPLPPPSTLKPELNPAIERVLLKALAKNQVDRFASCADFLAAWKQALIEAEKSPQVVNAVGKKPVALVEAAPQANQTPSAQKRAELASGLFGRRLWVVASLAIVVVVGLIGSIALFTMTSSPAIPPPTVAAVAIAPTATIAPTSTPLPRPTATLIPPSPTPIAIPTATATQTNVERTTTLLAQIDEPWSKSDWVKAIDLLTQARALDANNSAIADKLYVAYYNYGKTLLSQGKKVEAAQQFQNALSVRVDGTEATLAMLSLTPTPTRPPCPTVVGAFANVWRLVQGNIGCATKAAIIGFIAEENFVRGKMFWREPIDINAVIALYNESRTWQEFRSEKWIESRPEFSCVNANTPAVCPPTPKRGFGQAWCNLSNGLRNLIGNATDCERGYNTVMQQFERGFMLQTDKGIIYVLYSNGAWETR